MKTLPLLLVFLFLAPFSAQAQVTASAQSLALAPTLVPGASGWQTVTFTNQTNAAIDVFGLGSNGPFGFGWECEGSVGGVVLAPLSTCVLSVRFEPGVGQPLGVVDGLVGFRLSSGTIQVRLRAFAYSDQASPGVQNLIDSITPLGFATPVKGQLQSLLARVQTTLLDGQPENDRRACGALRRVIRLVEGEAASDRVMEWSAVAMTIQAEAVAAAVGCHGQW